VASGGGVGGSTEVEKDDARSGPRRLRNTLSLFKGKIRSRDKAHLGRLQGPPKRVLYRSE